MTRKFKTMADLFLTLAPSYRSYNYPHFICSVPWERETAAFVQSISPRRWQKRLDSYVIPGEFKRSRGSIRFGNKKEGRGFTGDRSDFCLLAGSIDKGVLSVFYRSVELVGGLHFDMAVWSAVEDHFGPIRRVDIFAAKAFVYGVRGVKSKSKERLYNALVEHYMEKSHEEV